MYSDDWLAKGWASDPPTRLHDAVRHRFWRDDDGAVVGACLDFEWAGDVHLELTLDGWRRLCAVLGTDTERGFTSRLKEVTAHQRDLEKLLRENDIPYARIAFW